MNNEEAVRRIELFCKQLHEAQETLGTHGVGIKEIETLEAAGAYLEQYVKAAYVRGPLQEKEDDRDPNKAE